MSDNYIKVTVTGNKSKSVSVKSTELKNQITAGADMSIYYSNKAKEWAISDKLVDNEDYSSKYHANLAKGYTEEGALQIAEITTLREQTLVDIETEKQNVIDMGREQINQVTTISNTAISDIETSKTNALSDIDSAKTIVLEDISTQETQTINNIKETADVELDKIVGTGIDSKVSKSGDTMTGNLQIEGALTVEGWNNTLYNMLVLKTDQDFTTAPEATSYPNIEIQDKNGLRMGRIEYQHQDDGGHRISLVDKKDANTATYASIFVGFDKDGNPICNFPKCTTKATTSSTAHSSNVAVIVQNYKNGTSWYRIWSDGWKEQGGRVTVKSKSSATVTFPKTFSDTNYSLATAIGSSTGGDYSFNITADVGYTTFSASKFSVDNFELGQNIKVCWIACGY